MFNSVTTDNSTNRHETYRALLSFAIEICIPNFICTYVVKRRRRVVVYSPFVFYIALESVSTFAER